MHRWSQLFIPTLREAPADAEVASHKLLLRAGYIRQLGAGIYSYLFLGNRSINKIVAIVREEMDKIAQEFFLPALNPAEIWQESGRWSAMGQNMFRLKDRKGADLCLAMTHEEVMTSIARNELRSYKQLPQIWYQIQTKFRDEPRPKSGLLRVRQFLMKDAYSFDIDEAGLDASYAKHDAAYRRIFTRCGLDFVAVEADSGSMGGSQSQEFMVYTDAGEDLIASCPKCNYAANLERATSKLAPTEDLPTFGDGKPAEVHTPGLKTIREVGAFLGVEPTYQIKTIAYMRIFHARPGQTGAELPLIFFLRGDHELNETALARIAPADEYRPMNADEIEKWFGAPAGSLGPINLPHGGNEKLGSHVFVDEALRGRSNLIAGANKGDFHLRNVTPDKDFEIDSEQWGNFRLVNEGDPCPTCLTPLHIGKAVEIGHIFKLGRKYTESMHATVLNKDGKETTPIMGSYGIGIERILTAAIESSAAKFSKELSSRPESPRSGDAVERPAVSSDSYALPPSIAPFQVIVTITNVREPELLAAGEQVALALEDAGFDVLLDDRDERAGVKFKDADLIGVPLRIAVGKKLAEGKVELLNRLTNQTHDIPLTEVTKSLSLLTTHN
jgi:prolyl-tRNA synthetase